MVRFQNPYRASFYNDLMHFYILVKLEDFIDLKIIKRQLLTKGEGISAVGWVGGLVIASK